LTNTSPNVGGRTDFALNRSHELLVEDARDCIARAGLLAERLRQATTYDWERSGSRSPQLVYEEEVAPQVRGPAGRTVTGSHVGWGFAGISHFFGGRTDRC